MKPNEKFFIDKVKAGKLIVTVDGDIFTNENGDYRKIGYYTNTGYVRIEKSENLKRYVISVHRLVWLIFKGDIPEDLVINHIDGNKKNNKLTNLELVTNEENYRHGIRTGLTNNVGENNPMSKFTENEILEIRKTYTEGIDVKDISLKYNVSRVTIYDILKGNSYPHLPNKIDMMRKPDRKSNSKYTEDILNNIKILNNAGHSDYEIAKIVGIPRSTIQRYRKNHL